MLNEPVTIFHLDIPLRTPFSNAGGTVSSRSVALVRVGSGPYGWGEAAPYPGQDESIEDVLGAARAGAATPTLRAASDEAATDLRARLAGDSLFHLVSATKERVPVSLAIGLGDPVDAVGHAVEQGIGRFKLKIEPGRSDHVIEIRRRHPEIVMGVDANGSFDPSTVHELEAISGLDIEYLEQPVADITDPEFGDVRHLIDAPVFADESVRSVSDAETVLACGHVDGIVVKPGRLGWSGAVVVRELANGSGKLWRASGLLETGIGRGFTDILAACPDAFSSDVAPAEWFLETDITRSRHVDGHMIVPSDAGLGIVPDPALVSRHLVTQIDLT